MKIRAISTFTDWTSLGGCWGKAGVYRIFDYLKIAGIKDIYWRVFNGGLAMYPSKVAQVQDQYSYEEWKKQQLYPQTTISVEYLKEINFNTYNPLEDAVKISNEFGINLYFWYTIYEDDHGGAFLSKFAKEHPQYWQMDKEGRSYRGTLDFFYDEVRKYKMEIIDELLSYKVNGLLLDFVRHNACPSSDKNGIHRFGYNPEIREFYKKKYGVDPIQLAPDDESWLLFKRDIMNSFIKYIKYKMECTETFRELSFMVWPVDYSKWACIDIPFLTRENIVQMICIMSIKYIFSPDEVVNQYNIIKPQVKNDKIRILPGICCYNNIYPSQVNNYAERGEKEGINELMLFEADALRRCNLTTTIRAINLNVPNYKRKLTAVKINNFTNVNWAELPEYSNFLFNSGKKKEQTPSEKTVVQIAYTDEEIIFKFICYDSNIPIALAPENERPENQYYLDALGPRTHYYYINSFNVFLDPSHSHENYYHFGISPKGEKTQETFVEKDWSSNWKASIEITKNSWSGIIKIPFKSIGVNTPSNNDKWGINILRGIRASDETNSWFYISSSLPVPDDMGHLEFTE